MTRKDGDYSQIWEWIYANFDVNAYITPEQLLYDVKNEFVRTGSYFPIQAEDLVKERFQYRRVYAEMQVREDEQKKIAEVIGGGQIMQSLSDEMVDDLRSPRSEIMDIDMTEYSTTRETVIPPDIVKYAQSATFFGRLTNRFRRLFRR